MIVVGVDKAIAGQMLHEAKCKTRIGCSYCWDIIFATQMSIFILLSKSCPKMRQIC
jgi:hypothetical protein